MGTRQYEKFNDMPHELYSLDLDIGGKVLVYFDTDYQGPTVVISGNKLLGVMPNVEEGLKLAKYAISPATGIKDVEIIPAESVHEVEHQSFDAWLLANSHV